MTDYMKEAKRLAQAYADAVLLGEGNDEALAALLAHIQRGAVPEALDPEFLIGYLEVREDWRGREFLIERIRQAAAPDQFRDATKMMAAPAGVPMPDVFMYGVKEPGGGAWMEEVCVSTLKGDIDELVDDLNVGRDDADTRYMPVSLVTMEDSKRYGDARSLASGLAGEVAGYEQVLSWAVSRWKDEVENRPLENKNRRPLDDVWRQVVRFAGGDPDALLGPSHDAALREVRNG